MPYLNLDIDYFDHPKTKRLVGLLGKGSEVLPLKLWSYCGKFHAETGNLAGYSGREIESLVGWWGKLGECVSAMETVGFIEKTDTGFRVHDWGEHAGHLAAFKARAKNAAAARWAKAKGGLCKKCSKHTTSNANGLCRQCSYLTIPNQPTSTADAVRVAVGAKLGWEIAWGDNPAAEQSQLDQWLLDHGGSVESLRDALLGALKAERRSPRKMSEAIGVYKVARGRKPEKEKRTPTGAAYRTVELDS